MFEAIRGLFASKKFIGALATTIAAVTAHYGLDLDPATIGVIITPGVSYIIGQGIADKGKEAEKVAQGITKEGTQP